MLIGEKVKALRGLRGWTFEETAAAVRAQGAKKVRYQHIQQLEHIPTRVPRYLLELAAAFGMSAEEFQSWRPSEGDSPELPGKDDGAVVETPSPLSLDHLASDIRQITMALILFADWARVTRPVEAPILESQLRMAAERIGADAKNSPLGLIVQAIAGDAEAPIRAHRRSGAGNAQE